MTRLPPPPALPRPPARVGFPVIAVLMPILAAVIIGLVTGSAFVLVFALLSPVIAIATMIDGRRTARRHRRDEAARFERECAAYRTAIDAAHAAESRADAARATSSVRVGVGPRDSAVAPEAPLLVADGEPDRRLADLVASAHRNPARPLLLPRGEVVVVGQGRAAAAMIARLELEPGVRVLHDPTAASSGAVSTLTVHSALRLELVTPDGATLTGRPELPSTIERAAMAASARGGAAPLPSMVAWRDLGPAARPAGMAPESVLIGRCAEGDAAIDLVADGPHALVGGTTGSGKSEFLRTLALGWAAQQSPEQLQLLFVDFKGGASFAGLMALPHAVGLVTDLDPLVAERTLRGLRAELRRRERLLVEHGVRDAAAAPAVLARLVVIVDEFAALIETFPELQGPFADISARGRSLGVHLVLGTQHPAAAVRDAVAANCALRIAFRLSESAGAAFVGSRGRELAGAPPGRALVVGAEGERAVQVAVIDDADIARVAERWAQHPSRPKPWLPPLPSRLTTADLHREAVAAQSAVPSPDERGVPFGLLDDPAELRRGIAAWNPTTDGALAVIGCPGSGRTATLAALAEAAVARGRAVRILPGSVPAAWELLTAIAGDPIAPPAPGSILVADDLDMLVAEAAERGPELLALWDAAARALRSAGGGVAAAVGPASASRSIVGARFSARLLLRALDAEDHLLGGAPRGLFDRSAPPGRGWWLDAQVQVVEPRAGLVTEPAEANPWQPPDDLDTVVVAAARDRALPALRAAFPDRAIVVGAPSGPPGPTGERGRLLVADGDEWQSAWTALIDFRRWCPVLAIGVSPGELRSLLGVRSDPPPIAVERGECWLIERGGEPPRRVRLPSAGEGTPEPSAERSG